MAKEMVYLKLTAESSTYYDSASGLKLVRDVPAAMTRVAFEKARNNKASDFKDRVGKQFVEISKSEYNALCASAEEQKTSAEAAEKKALKGAMKKLKQKFGPAAVAAAAQPENQEPQAEEDEDEDEDLEDVNDEAEDEDENGEDENEEDEDEEDEDVDFEDMTKAELVKYITDNHDDYDGDDKKELGKKNKKALIVIASEVE